ncbi:hypothetical protein BB934_05180 [Microvirga ossetica]|uniref:Methyltransferase domain-containing protein n=2 Tax=Microvirga ossetica TaxID=1882682 RepID=A0A1B2ECI7_9HYPH|nr:hypothetical protein BB934_05180 [Microvirga ossetica]
MRCVYSDGVYIDDAWEPAGVTEQFLGNAEIYHERYFSDAYWKYLLDRGLTCATVDIPNTARVLDIGSGSGNTALIAATIFNGSEVFASDISPQLLKILMKLANNAGLTNVKSFCFDLHKDFFAPASFDLVIGGAILHHMLDPLAALKNVAKWLKPGAPIIMMEPMEAGGHLMCAVYQTILDECGEELDPRIAHFLNAMVQDYEARFGVPRVKPWTGNLDDKWLFNRTYLKWLVNELGLRLDSVNAMSDDSSRWIESMIRGNLSTSGNATVPTPPRMWEVVAEFDQGISTTVKRYLMQEAIIVLRK